MGKVLILPQTTTKPITLIGQMAGVCYGADITDEKKNYRRGWSCIKSGHGRTLEFPDVYMEIDGYTAGVAREWYTHIGGGPTRLQASTRRIPYYGFGYVTPPSIAGNLMAVKIYDKAMEEIDRAREELAALEIPAEDTRNLLPLGMTTRLSCKHNLRNLIDMSRQRECERAHWEYRDLFQRLKTSLANYSDEWAEVVAKTMHPKCMEYGYCPEEEGCGRYPGREA